ncbi:MAG: HAMP domain-containing histidine kinase [Gemmatimonadetes bacterium]|nr:HAMP domain-containing histidine kinase [Gemmatimonadota bacterium]
MLFFLLVTLGLSLWLGFQAVGAARSHRITAEGVLRDYAEIAVSEYSRRVQGNLDRFFREVFRDVPRQVRSGVPPDPGVVSRNIAGALRRVSCECSRFRASVVSIMQDFGSGQVVSVPDSVSFGEKSRAAGISRAAWEAAPAERIALRTVGASQGLSEPSVLFFNASLDRTGEEGAGRAIYVLQASLDSSSELFDSWYRRGALLPEAVVGGQPNDSLLHLAVSTGDGIPVFLSPIHTPDVVVVSDTLSREYGGLIIEVGVRPDAASTLVIGGLPRARLPLLLALMVMTVGVGIAAFIQIRKEEELAQVRDDFISGVSHEFRTPLTHIRMFTELLADGKLRTDEERFRSTEVINREARRLTHLVENILHFSRMGRAPRSRGAAERILVEEAIGDLTEAFDPLVRSKGCELEIVVSPPTLEVSASRSGLHRMLANLLDNALKYGPEGQRIRIAAGGGEGWVRISVEDQGPGIPAGERSRIWDPYHRLERDMEGQVRGSGIGLSVVAELAEASGGAALVEEGRDGGARFVIRLPMPEDGMNDPVGRIPPEGGTGVRS